MFYEGINAKVFRPSFAFTIALVVTSHSSSFKYTMSVHAVHAGAERNVCNIVVSTETPKTTTNPSQTLLPMYKPAHLPLPHSKSSSPRPPQPLTQPFAQMRYRCIRSCLPAKIYLKGMDTTILHTFLSALACTACTDMVYSKELERDVTTSMMAKAILRLKTLAFIPS